MTRGTIYKTTGKALTILQVIVKHDKLKSNYVDRIASDATF